MVQGQTTFPVLTSYHDKSKSIKKSITLFRAEESTLKVGKFYFLDTH